MLPSYAKISLGSDVWIMAARSSRIFTARSWPTRICRLIVLTEGSVPALSSALKTAAGSGAPCTPRLRDPLSDSDLGAGRVRASSATGTPGAALYSPARAISGTASEELSQPYSIAHPNVPGSWPGTSRRTR